MRLRVARQIVGDLPLLDGVDRVEHLDKGYSHDKKYVLWDTVGPRYLLRISGIEFLERRRRQFDLMERHRGHGVLCPEPLAFGVHEDGSCCYSLLEFLPGRDAEEVLPEMAEDRQYAIGRAAGRQLSLMHQVTPDESDRDWPSHRRAKYKRYVDEARRLGVTVEGLDSVEAYVEANLGLLESAQVRFQHDDFHPGNIIVQDGELVGTVDFNQADWGDPIEDFYKVPWFTVPVSAAFARGQVDGYISGPPRHDFWRRYNLYVAMSVHASLSWGHKEPRSSLQMFERLAREIIDTHDFTAGGLPAWF